jgi:hypothetical protein
MAVTLAPTTNRTRPADAAPPIGGVPNPTRSPRAPAALRAPSEHSHGCGTPNLVTVARTHSARVQSLRAAKMLAPAAGTVTTTEAGNLRRPSR